MEQKETKISGKVVYEGKVVTLKVDTVLCPNGNESKREIITHNGGAAILVVLEDKILLERQFRYAYGEVIYEIPAGKLEKGENPKEAAIRELAEETGYIANNIIDLGSIYPSVGYTDEIIYLYAVTDVTLGTTNLDEDEVIGVEFFSLDEIHNMISENIIRDSKTICAIYKYELLKKVNEINH